MLGNLLQNLVPEKAKVAVNAVKLIGLIGRSSLQVPPLQVDEAHSLKQAMSGLASAKDKEEFIEAVRNNQLLSNWIDEGYLPPQYALEDLANSKPGSLGEGYYNMLKEYDLGVQIFPDFEIKNALDYFDMRGQQTHDYWHLVSGYPPTAMGEMGLVAFYIGNYKENLGDVGAKLCSFLSLILGISVMEFGLHMPELLPKLLETVGDGVRRGRAAKPLVHLQWEEMWDRSLDEIRAELNVEIPDIENLRGQVGRALKMAS